MLAAYLNEDFVATQIFKENLFAKTSWNKPPRFSWFWQQKTF
jgi:hypothetical protein